MKKILKPGKNETKETILTNSTCLLFQVQWRPAIPDVKGPTNFNCYWRFLLLPIQKIKRNILKGSSAGNHIHIRCSKSSFLSFSFRVTNRFTPPCHAYYFKTCFMLAIKMIGGKGYILFPSNTLFDAHLFSLLFSLFHSC